MVLATLAYTLQAQQERILEFQGLNKKSVIDDGEMRDMLNLSSDEYPCLYQRKPRAVYSDRYKKPTAMIVKDSKLAVISDGVFYYDGQEYGNEGQFSDQTRMVAINSKICFSRRNAGSVYVILRTALSESSAISKRNWICRLHAG